MKLNMNLDIITVGLILLCSLRINLVNSYELPFQPCPSEDKACLTEAMNTFTKGLARGIPELDIPSGDPYKIDHLDMSMDTLEMSLGLGELFGFSKCKVEDFRIEQLKKNINGYLLFTIYCDRIRIVGKYKANGSLLVKIPINGEGDADFDIRGMRIKVTVPYNNEINEENYLKVKPNDYKYALKVDNAHYDLTNLNGQLLGQTSLNMLNENWSEIIDKFVEPASKEAITYVVQAYTKLFSKFPLRSFVTQ